MILAFLLTSYTAAFVGICYAGYCQHRDLNALRATLNR